MTLLEEEKMKKLFQITEAILTIYQNLTSLEIEGKKDTPLYQKQLEYLEISKEVEKNKYNELSIKPDNIDKYLEYARTNKSLTCSKRIIDMLYLKYVSNSQNILDTFRKNPEYEGLREQGFFYENDSTLREIINNQQKMQLTYDKWIRIYTLSFLDSLIKEEKDIELKNVLIKKKNLFICENPSIEEYFINNYNNLENLKYNETDIFAYENDIPLVFVKVFKDKYVRKEAVLQIAHLLDIRNSEYTLKDSYADMLYRSSYLKATLTILPKSSIMELKNGLDNMNKDGNVSSESTYSYHVVNSVLDSFLDKRENKKR